MRDPPWNESELRISPVVLVGNAKELDTVNAGNRKAGDGGAVTIEDQVDKSLALALMDRAFPVPVSWRHRTPKRKRQMTGTVFFSWQSDLPETRSTILWALERAVRDLNRGDALEEALRVDQDTDKVAGWPDIAATILAKIEHCELFVADLTPVNGPDPETRLTPNPNVMLELGYALATGVGRTRIVCIVNDAYLPERDLSRLPFDVRGSRPLSFSLQDPTERGVKRGREDRLRTAARENLTKALKRALDDSLDAVEAERQSQSLAVRPHLVMDDGGTVRVIFELTTGVPFQVKFLVKEPSGNVLSGIMMAPHPVDPEGKKFVRFQAMQLKPLTTGNDICVLQGEVGHVASEQRRVPEFHKFKVSYRFSGKELQEVERQDPAPH